MNLTKVVPIRWGIVASYFILGILILMSIKTSIFQNYLIWFVGIGTLFLIREYLLFFGIPKNAVHTIFDWKAFRNDIQKNNVEISKVNALVILNREIFFPFFLVISLLLLLVRQLDIHTFVEILDIYSWIEYFFFLSFAITAFGTIFQLSLADTYYIKKIHSTRMRIFVCVDILISIGTTLLVFLSSSTMWFFCIPISIISWVLVFSLWIFLLVEEEVYLP